MTTASRFSTKTQVFLYLAFVLIASFFTYFYRYEQPAAVFWDEPYHIASAQKYLNGVYFMEQHPPLGKLLIALGEKITHKNARNDQFIGTDYARDFPADFSFAGYRLFPALLAWLTAPLLFFIFLLITRNPGNSTLLSFLYIFDNALIVHNRGAMIDSTLIFFSVLMILLFFLLLECRKSRHLFWGLSLLFGLVFGCVMTTKVVGLIMILLVPAILFRLYPGWRQMFTLCALFIVGFLLSFCSVWYVHFTLGTHIDTRLSNNGYYQASDAYKSYITNHTTASLLSFPRELFDSLSFVTYYNRGVPRLDLCKEDENGSPFFFWPFGARSINYRWASVNDAVYRYLYLQANPVAWLCGLIGIALSFCILISTVLFLPKHRPKHLFLMVTFFGMYASYMIAISRLDRVMYLYHYFTPLIFSFILFALVFENIHSFGKRVLDEHKRSLILTLIAILVFAGFQAYRPLTYYEPISDKRVQQLSIFRLWELRCVRCEHTSMLVVPVTK